MPAQGAAEGTGGPSRCRGSQAPSRDGSPHGRLRSATGNPSPRAAGVGTCKDCSSQASGWRSWAAAATAPRSPPVSRRHRRRACPTRVSAGAVPAADVRSAAERAARGGQRMGWGVVLLRACHRSKDALHNEPWRHDAGKLMKACPAFIEMPKNARKICMWKDVCSGTPTGVQDSGFAIMYSIHSVLHLTVSYRHGIFTVPWQKLHHGANE